MCDERTENENQIYLQQQRIGRRQVSAGAGATLAAMWTGCSAPRASREPPRAAQAPQPPSASPSVVRAQSAQPHDASESTPEAAAPAATTARQVTVETPDGSAEGFFVSPEGKSYPGVLMWPDIAGLRDAFRAMATRLAGAGYAVLVVNPYYRSSQLPVLTTFDEWRTDEGREKVRPMREALTPDTIRRDAVAFLSWLDRQEEVAQDKQLAVTGYCMTGPFTFRAAAAVERVGAIASFHGGGLVTDEPTSPHRLLSAMDAAALICIAQNDDERAPEAKATLRRAAEAAQVPAEIEVYPAQHGFCVLDSPVYDEAQAERAWARMLATFERHL